jgi:DNA polymerase-1
LRYRAGSREAAFAIFNELGFRALAKEYAPTADTIAKSYRVVNTADGVRALAERLRAAGRFAFRVLPDGPTAMRAAIVGMSFSTSARDGDYVPIAIDRRQQREPSARYRVGRAAAAARR